MTKLKAIQLETEDRPLKEWSEIAIGGTLREDGAPVHELERRFAWPTPWIKKLLASAPLTDSEGPDVLSISIADFEGKSPMRARHVVENALVRSLVLSLGGKDCNRLIGRRLKINDRQIGRIRERAGLPSASQMKPRAKKLPAAA
ncbi:MAG TPA: hypothetical protein VGN17_01955 [Bryobacteraceae bacterium]|jgi:hypothetical protein